MCCSGSTLMTSAPHSASSCVQCGPAQTTVMSSTRTRSSGSRLAMTSLLPRALGAAPAAGRRCRPGPCHCACRRLDPLPAALPFDPHDRADAGIRVVAGADLEPLALDAVEDLSAGLLTGRRVHVEAGVPVGVLELR